MLSCLQEVRRHHAWLDGVERSWVLASGSMAQFWRPRTSDASDRSGADWPFCHGI